MVGNGPDPGRWPPESFFRRQLALHESEGLFHEPSWFEVEDVDDTNPQFKRVWSRLPDACRDYDRIELWIDPDPNAQLVMLQLLAWLGTLPDIVPRLWLKQSDSPLGQRHPGDWILPPRPVEAADLALSRRAWSAFGAATPEAWAALRGEPDFDRLPGLRHAIGRMLRELPDVTGLGATERRLLSLTEKQDWWLDAARCGEDMSDRILPDKERGPLRLMQRVSQSGERVPMGFFELGRAICDLGAAPVPALFGLDEPHFSIEMDLDPERRQRFSDAAVRLTDLGHRLVAGTDDWSKHNPVHRWIGGTRLMNDTLWRWDEDAGRLLEPT